MGMAEEEQEAVLGRRVRRVSMKTKVLVSGTAYLALLAGLLVASAPLAMEQLGPADSRGPEPERFGIRLLSTEALVISDEDILSYNKTSYEMILGETGVASIGELGLIPVNGTGFAVIVDGHTIYTGAFWTPISSIGYDGVILMIEIPVPNTLKFELGYPGPSEGPDPRDNPRIADVFRSLGKLVQ